MNNIFRRRAEDKVPRRQRKGMYLLPSIFTAANMFFGFWAILQALQGSASDPRHFDYAAMAIGFAIIFDGVDGTVARLTNTTSDFGKELDSLADVTTFGVAPAVLAWMWGFRTLQIPIFNSDAVIHLRQFGEIMAFLFLVAGASRLARFNIQLNPQPSNPGRPGRKYFVGMPIPAGAGCLAAVVHFFKGVPLAEWWEAVIWCAFVAFAGFLMVSTWRFWSSKNIDWKSRQSFRYFILLCGIAAGVFFFSRYVLVAMALAYMLSGVLARLTFTLRRSSATPRAPQPTTEV
jgi:CDP-diacylglycerol---serine O-phosphatidyltransferase